MSNTPVTMKLYAIIRSEINIDNKKDYQFLLRYDKSNKFKEKGRILSNLIFKNERYLVDLLLNYYSETKIQYEKQSY